MRIGSIVRTNRNESRHSITPCIIPYEIVNRHRGETVNKSLVQTGSRNTGV